MSNFLKNSDDTYYAKLKMARISPSKMNLVAEHIRGCSVQEALGRLHTSRKQAAVYVKKCLLSSVANAQNNHDVSDINTLRVSECYVGKNKTMKRIQWRSKGRRGLVRKEFSQVTVVLRKV